MCASACVRPRVCVRVCASAYLCVAILVSHAMNSTRQGKLPNNLAFLPIFVFLTDFNYAWGKLLKSQWDFFENATGIEARSLKKSKSSNKVKFGIGG